MAYTKAIALLSRAETELGFALTDRTIGGGGGGGSTLTPQASDLLARYALYRQQCAAAADALFERHFAAFPPAAAPPARPAAPPRRPVLGCVVMASGAATRFGANKLLAPLGGRPVLAHTLAALPRDVFAPLVVTRWDEVEALCKTLGTACRRHQSPLQSDTIRQGLAQSEGWDGCLFLAGDQPLVAPGSLRRLADAFARSPDVPARLGWQGRGGNPVLFPRRMFGALQTLQGDTGGGSLLRYGGEEALCVEAAAPWELWDADTPQELARLADLLPLCGRPAL